MNRTQELVIANLLDEDKLSEEKQQEILEDMYQKIGYAYAKANTRISRINIYKPKGLIRLPIREELFRDEVGMDRCDHPDYDYYCTEVHFSLGGELKLETH